MLPFSFEEEQPWTYGSAASGRFARKKLELPSVSPLHRGWGRSHAPAAAGQRRRALRAKWGWCSECRWWTSSSGEEERTLIQRLLKAGMRIDK
jgi:hypothetical protein